MCAQCLSKEMAAFLVPPPKGFTARDIFDAEQWDEARRRAESEARHGVGASGSAVQRVLDIMWEKTKLKERADAECTEAIYLACRQRREARK